MGIYNIFLNKKIIPNSIIKNSKKIYRSTRFYNNEITLEVCDGYLVELSSEGRVKLFFEDIENLINSSFTENKFYHLFNDLMNQTKK